jgi:hypothetical protein
MIIIDQFPATYSAARRTYETDAAARAVADRARSAASTGKSRSSGVGSSGWYPTGVSCCSWLRFCADRLVCRACAYLTGQQRRLHHVGSGVVGPRAGARRRRRGSTTWIGTNHIAFDRRGRRRLSPRCTWTYAPVHQHQDDGRRGGREVAGGRRGAPRTGHGETRQNFQNTSSRTGAVQLAAHRPLVRDHGPPARGRTLGRGRRSGPRHCPRRRAGARAGRAERAKPPSRKRRGTRASPGALKVGVDIPCRGNQGHRRAPRVLAAHYNRYLHQSPRIRATRSAMEDVTKARYEAAPADTGHRQDQEHCRTAHGPDAAY